MIIRQQILLLSVNLPCFFDFLDECCLVEPGAKERASVLYGRFVEWYHANCGTNLVTAGFLAGLFSFVALLPRSRRRLDQLPLAVMAATLAVVAAQPLGRVVQANVTTTSHVRNLLIKRITRRQQNRLIVHHIETAAY